MSLAVQLGGSCYGFVNLAVGGYEDAGCRLVTNVARFCGDLCHLAKMPHIFESHDVFTQVQRRVLRYRGPPSPGGRGEDGRDCSARGEGSIIKRAKASGGPQCPRLPCL